MEVYSIACQNGDKEQRNQVKMLSRRGYGFIKVQNQSANLRQSARILKRLAKIRVDWQTKSDFEEAMKKKFNAPGMGPR
jgi:hypothetical protein